MLITKLKARIRKRKNSEKASGQGKLVNKFAVAFNRIQLGVRNG